MNCPPPHDRNIIQRVRYKEAEEIEAMDAPISSFPCWPLGSTEYKSCEFLDPYDFGPGIADFPEANLMMGMQVAELPENLYWAEPSSPSNLPENFSPSTTSTTDNITSDIPLTKLIEYMEKLPTTSQNNEVHASGQEQYRNTKRKRSASHDNRITDAKERKRVRSVVRHLQWFEDQQRRYGKRQLKAIKNSST